MENITPIPKVEVKIIDDIPSKIDLVKRVVLSPFKPLSNEPTIAIAPTQNKRLEVIKPWAILPDLPFLLNSLSRNAPTFSNHLSISIIYCVRFYEDIELHN